MSKWFKLGIILALALAVAPVSGCLKGHTGVTETQFKNLLTLQDIQKLSTPADIDMKGSFYNYKTAPDMVPEQTLHMNSYYGVVFMSDDQSTGLALTVVDFDSVAVMQQYLHSIQADSQLKLMDKPIATTSLEREFNSKGLGSVLLFQKGNTLVEMLTGVPEGVPPFMTLQNLEELARGIAAKL